MYLILGILCTWYTLYMVYLVPVSCIWSILYLEYLYLLPGVPFTLYWCTLYLVYSVPGVPCSWCTLYLVYLKHLMTWFLCTEGLEGLGDMRHDLVQHPEYHDVIIMLPKYDDKSCPLIWRKDLYLLHKTMQRWMYWRSRTPMAKLAARITAIRIKSRCSLHLHKCQIFAAWLTIIINQDNLNFLKKFSEFSKMVMILKYCQSWSPECPQTWRRPRQRGPRWVWAQLTPSTRSSSWSERMMVIAEDNVVDDDSDDDDDDDWWQLWWGLVTLS